MLPLALGLFTDIPELPVWLWRVSTGWAAAGGGGGSAGGISWTEAGPALVSDALPTGPTGLLRGACGLLLVLEVATLASSFSSLSTSTQRSAAEMEIRVLRRRPASGATDRLHACRRSSALSSAAVPPAALLTLEPADGPTTADVSDERPPPEASCAALKASTEPPLPLLLFGSEPLAPAGEQPDGDSPCCSAAVSTSASVTLDSSAAEEAN